LVGERVATAAIIFTLTYLVIGLAWAALLLR